MNLAHMVMNGVAGAARFAEALALGDVADDAAVDRRRSVCRACPSRVRAVAPGAIFESDWCGEPLVDDGRTCGCLIYGKTLVGSEACPQGKW